MKKVTSADSLITVTHYKNLLEHEGIEAFIKNEHLAAVLGEIPFQHVWPELWVKNDLYLDYAREIIAAANEPEVGGEAWKCLYCGETNEAQFGACWSCEKPQKSAE